MHLSSEQYQSQLDQQLNHQYHQICFNPNHKQILSRLIKSQPSNYNDQFKQRKSNLLDNGNIMVYVNGVYQKYGIEDPIKKHMRLSSGYHLHTTPQKSQNMTQITDSDRLTRTKRRLLSMKDSFRRDSEDIAESSQFTHNASYREEKSMIQQSKKNKQIGYRTKQKIRFKTIANQEHIQVNPKQIIIGEQKSIRYSEARRQIQKYCIMCQQKIYQDIHLHLPKCREGTQAYLSDAELQRNVDRKIKSMEQQICQILFFKNQQNIVYRYKDLRSTIQQWLNSSQIPFQSIKDKFNFYSLDLFDRLSKLNWFRNMHLKMVVKNRFSR